MYSKYLHPAWLRGWQKWENQNSNRGLNYCGVRQASWKSILNIKIKCRVGSKSRGGLVRETKIVQLKMMNFPVSTGSLFFFFFNFFSSLPTLGLARNHWGEENISLSPSNMMHVRLRFKEVHVCLCKIIWWKPLR